MVFEACFHVNKIKSPVRVVAISKSSKSLALPEDYAGVTLALVLYIRCEMLLLLLSAATSLN